MSQKSLCTAYFLWLFGGYFGLHHLYLRRYKQAFVWWCLPGGYFGAGWIRDLWRIPSYVQQANSDPGYVRRFKEKVKELQKPAFSFARCCGQLFTGNVLGMVVVLATPNSKDAGMDLSLAHTLVMPAAIAVGIWVVGNIGEERGSIWPTLLTCYLLSPLYYFGHVNTAVVSLAGLIVFNWWSKEWRLSKDEKNEWPTWKNFLVLVLCCCLYSSLWLSYIYFNLSIVTKEGDEIKVRDAIGNFINSPAFMEFQKNVQALWKHALEFGFVSTFQQLIESLDPLGELNALKVLELERGASQEEIRTRYRTLTKQWHPDRVKDPEMKQEAQEIFVEIQQAYEKLSSIKARRAKRNKMSADNPGQDSKRR